MSAITLHRKASEPYIEFRHCIKFTCEKAVPIRDVAESLMALEKLTTH